MENNAIKVQMGQAIRRLREKERLSQERLALMVGISRQHLSNVESGKANVSVVVLLKIAEGLQEKLGLMTGISRQYLIKIEHGVANPTVELLYRIACGLGTKMTRILDEADLDELSSFPEGR